jgi:leucyl aminopeptidase (aminopeptidase T)
MSELDQAVNTVIRRCLGVLPDECVVVVADEGSRPIGDALREAAAAAGAEAVLNVMAVREEHGQEPPAPVAAALAASDVFIAPTTKSLSHTRARKAANDAGARGATLPGVTEDMLARLMTCDFPTLQRRSLAVAKLLSDARHAHVTCPRGTDLTLDLTGRHGIPDDGDLTAERAFGNLPCGEGFISPVGGHGTLVAASLAGLGLPDEPVRMSVRDGRLADAAGDWGARWAARLDGAGGDGRNLAELGVGTNERATLTGLILEDEKMLGTVHVAFGASAGIGGTVSVPIHLDCLIADATLDVGGTRVLDAGRFVLAA